MDEKIIFKPHKKGTTLLSQKFNFERDEVGPVDLTDAVIKLVMKTDPIGEVEYEFSTTNGKITVDPLLGNFETVEENISIPAFDYICAIQIELPNGVNHEPMKFIWPINQDIV